MMIVQLTAIPLVRTPSQWELWELMVSQVPLMSSALQSWSLHMSPIHLGALKWYNINHTINTAAISVPILMHQY